MSNAVQKEFQEKALPLLDEVYGVALRMTRNPQAAEDLVSETYARDWKNLDQFQAGTNIRAWIYRIMTNAYINLYRKQHRRPQSVALDAYDKIEDFHLFNQVAKRAAASMADPFEDVVSRLTDADFRAALDKLPDEYKTAIILYDLQGLSYQEVADALDIPLGTVRSRLARGRRILQSSLWKHAVDAGLVKDKGNGAAPTEAGAKGNDRA